MLDPVIDFVKGLFARIAAFILSIKSLFLPPAKNAESGKRKSFWVIRYAVRLTVLFAILIWTVPFVWQASYIRDFDLGYPQKVLRTTHMVSADEQVEVGGDAKTTRTHDRSMLVDMEVYLLNFSIDKNEWVPAMPQYKFGFFGIPWANTPFMDNKAAFQHGVLNALRRTAVELNDTLGRIRGTSEADPDLQMARGNIQYDDETYWFNPFNPRLPFGPVQPSPYVFRKAENLYRSYNDRLAKGDALFDTRSDNLNQFLDRVSKDIGSTVDKLSKRANSARYDAKTDKFIPGKDYNLGWFDFHADDYFYEALGEMYAYHGLLQAARVDFDYVVRTRGLGDIWDQMEEHVAEAAALNPLIVSNGSRDGFIMPAHLASMSEIMLRARANMSEIEAVLSR